MTEPLYLFAESAFPLPAYWAGLFLALLLCAALFFRQARRQGTATGRIIAFLVTAVLFSLFLGRLIYVFVNRETIFFDELGDYSGLSAFFVPAPHGFSIIGVISGILAAAFLVSGITRSRMISLLDQAAAPLALLFGLARLLEPLSGQGYGEIVEAPFPQFFPFSLENDMGERLLSVSSLSAFLALAVFLVLVLWRRGLAGKGFKAVFALVFLSIPQIIPESLRRDDVLFIFIFARVTQVGYMLIYSGTTLYVLLRQRKRGVPAARLALRGLCTLVLIAVCIGCEFALDKTNYPKLAIYLVFAVTLCALAVMTWKQMERKPV
ncbi:MAG: prolipoprotein diacylglyceryl transferase family protein [Christensenellales bacterium]|jgi:prolipoprotein diacylglyceryltransferase